MPDHMFHSRIKGLSVYFIFSLLLASCAIIVPPTGGPKDTTPPKVVSYSPDNKSTHFSGHKIKITYDEYIQLKGLDKQLMVSPPLKRPPQTMVIGKTLEITFKDTLKDNSTYTFNFGNAIADNNEGNQIRNSQYVISTGDHIDSLSISGNVQDAFTHDAIKNGFVMLYSDLSDSAPYKQPPTYIGLTDDNGHYTIENVAAGEYRLIAVSNVQGDYLYHPYIEGIGFKTRLTEIDGHDTGNLNVFYETEPKLKLLKTQVPDRGEIMITFNKPAKNISITPINVADSEKPSYTFMNYSATGDSVYYWVNTPFIDSVRFIASNGKELNDTAFAHGFPNNSNQRHVKKPKPVKLKL